MRTILITALSAYVLSATAFIAYLVANTHAGYVLGVELGVIDVPEITPLQKKTVLGQMRLDRNLTSDRIVFLGDSHIAGLDVTQITKEGVNFGIGSETTTGLLARIDRYQSVRKARGIVIGIGYNDIGLRDNSRIVENIRSILSRIRVPIALSGVLPVSPESPNAHKQATPLKNAAVASINAMLQPICTQHCVYVNVDATFSDPRRRARYYEEDGVHLNKEGYRIWTALFSKVVSKF